MSTVEVSMIDGLEGEQLNAFVRCVDHLVSKVYGKYLIFNAPGGTGKTYVLRKVISYLKSQNMNIAVIAYTGRAASQLSRDGLEATTCHSLLYKPRFDANQNVIGWDEKHRDEVLAECSDGIVVDEGSMIPYSIHLLLDRLGVQIIYTGDHDQLDPVEPGNDVEFNTMTTLSRNLVTLKENRRFGIDTGIGYITTHLRQQNSIPRIKKDGLVYVRKSAVLTEQFHHTNKFDTILCGMNKTRKKINQLVRQARGYYDSIPEVGETVVCLRNNILRQGGKINNGELFIVQAVFPGEKTSTFMLLDEYGEKTISVDVMNETWESEKSPMTQAGTSVQVFGFGYCLSVHKAQGSTFGSVLFVDEDVSFFLDHRKFRYTATSRAANLLTVAI